ncbi:HIT domain-containing protein [Amycolatopsis sp. lyj-23]|uniref:HIT domain-containing protein n=1 Tax=Amycolatopsis sp. lyj-23 TaxID=2789283 RepID=UPI00397E8FC0
MAVQQIPEPAGVAGCVPCDMMHARVPLPGGPIHETSHWLVMHVLGTFGPGALAVVPRRHVVHVADLAAEEAGELGSVLTEAAAVVTALTDPVQVYTCQWSHTGGVAAHIHFILQPIRRSDMERHPGKLGPVLQAAMFTAENKPGPAEVEAFAELARAAFARRPAR